MEYFVVKTHRREKNNNTMLWDFLFVHILICNLLSTFLEKCSSFLQEHYKEDFAAFVGKAKIMHYLCFNTKYLWKTTRNCPRESKTVFSY